MALKRISDYTAATLPLAGTEMLEVETASGQSRKVAAQDVADLGGGSTAPQPYFGGMFGETDVPHGYKLTKKGVVIARGGSGSWKESRVEGPNVFWDPKIAKYRMVFLGYSGTPSAPNEASIGFATADTPDGPWTEYGSNPVLPPSGTSGAPDQHGCSAPYVWYEDGTYYLYYLGLTATGLEMGNKSICLATSTDFLAWTRHGAVILPQAATWRANAVWHPHVVKRGETYYLFFNANTGTETIGYATSTDLMSWSVDDTNSPILGVGSSGAWDAVRVGDPFVWRVRDTWYMSYYAANASSLAQEGMATTTDASFPLGWVKFSGNPVLTVGSSGEMDDHDAARTCRLTTPTRHFCWYTTHDGSTPPLVQIALAVDDTLRPAATGVQSIGAGTGIAVDNTDPMNPVVSYTGGGGGGSFVGCRAINTSVVTIPSGVSTAISFTTEEYDTSSIHDNSTNPTRFTVPSGMSGRWRITFKASIQSGGGTVAYVFAAKNGVANVFASGTSGSASDSQKYFANSMVQALNAGDYVELFLFSNASTTLGNASDVGQGTAFEMEYLG